MKRSRRRQPISESERLLRELPRTRRTAADRLLLDARDPIAFEELVLPFVRVARVQLRQRSVSRAFTPRARAAAERALIRSLSDLCVEVLETRFSLYRARHEPLVRVGRASQPSRDLYRRFARLMRKSGWRELLREYPALGELMTTYISFWVRNTAILEQRVARDRRSLARMLGIRSLGRVTGLESALSDRHDGGQAVTLCTFASGHKLMYKPRDLALEARFHELCAWLNASGLPLALRPCRVLDRGKYGWEEFIPSRACRSRAETQRYFRRAGMLLCLLDLLQASDCHFQNVIPSGEHPVLVDAETLFQPRTPLLPGASESRGLLRVGLLPRLTRTAAGVVDLSALGCLEPQNTPFSVPQLSEANADAMRLDFLPCVIAAPPGRNPRKPEAFVDDVVLGFRQMRELLAARRDALLSPGSPLLRMRGLRMRLIARSTTDYTLMLNQSLRPDCLRDADTRRKKLQSLLRGPRRMQRLVAAERAALEQCDVPRLTGTTDGRRIFLNGALLPGVVALPAFQQVCSNLEKLGRATHARDLAAIRVSFAARSLVSR